MSGSTLQRMVTDPFSFFNIFLIFILTTLITTVIAIPLLDLLVLQPEGESLSSAALFRRDLFYSPKAVFILVLIQNIVLISLIYIRVIYLGKYRLADLDVNLRSPLNSIKVGLGFGALFLFIMLMISAIFSALGIEGEPTFGTPKTITELTLVLVIGVIFAPVGEELFFRAYIVTALKKRYDQPFVYIFSAGLFALLHFDLVTMAPIFIFGLLLVYVFNRYKSVLPCIIIHGLNNFVAIMLLYYYG